MKVLSLVLIALLGLSCSSKPKEIPIEEIHEDLIWVADETAKNILGFCKNEKDLEEFNKRSSVKARLQKGAGKYMLTCMIYGFEVSKIELKELYKVTRLKGNVKRFKYKLNIESDTYDLMELHVDINQDKFLANYSIHGRDMNGKWESLITKLELEARKFYKM